MTTRPNEPCAAANPTGASRLPSLRPVRRVAELESFGGVRQVWDFSVLPVSQ